MKKRELIEQVSYLRSQFSALRMELRDELQAGLNEKATIKSATLKLRQQTERTIEALVEDMAKEREGRRRAYADLDESLKDLERRMTQLEAGTIPLSTKRYSG